MATYFISDLHLSPEQPELAKGLTQFLRHARADATSLYILGDFFNVWIGDDEDDAFYLNIAKEIADFSAEIGEVFFMHGNRDFLIGNDFCTKAGMMLLNDPHTLELGDTKVLLMHGDSLCIDDVEYMQFRQQVRSKEWQQHVLSLPLEQRRIMAAQMRQQSQSMNSNKAEDIMDVNTQEVERVIGEYQCDILLHGHTHRPGRHNLNNAAERIVLGDWGVTGWYLKAENNHIELNEFALEG